MFNIFIKKIIIYILIIFCLSFFLLRPKNYIKDMNNINTINTSNEIDNPIKISTIYKSDAYNLRIQYIILHYTALDDELSLKVLTSHGVSSHYLITTKEEEPIYKLVEESNRAWHAGITMFENRGSINDSSVGIEIVNLGFQRKVTNTPAQLRRMTRRQRENRYFLSYNEYIDYEESQIEKVAYLLKELVKKYDIKQVEKAIEEILTKEEISSLTNDNDVRSYLGFIISPKELRRILLEKISPSITREDITNINKLINITLDKVLKEI